MNSNSQNNRSFICRTHGAVDFESLPASKTMFSMLKSEKRCNYTQFQGAFDDKFLYLRICAFENIPDENSRIILLLKGKELFSFTFYADSTSYVDLHCKYHFINGEDLQGVYWGVEITIEREALGLSGSELSLYGNVIKAGGGDFPHLCSVFECGAKFDSSDDFDPQLLPQNDLKLFSVI